jgi:hypothetical protein
MRLIIALGLSLLLTHCTTTDDHQQIIYRWQKRSVTQLIQYWGKPSAKIIYPNGQALYLYKITASDTSHPASPAIGVNAGSRNPVIVVNTPHTEDLSLSCLITFIVSHHIIERVIVKGHHCDR